MTEPVEIVVKRFQCPHCPRSYSARKAAREHVQRCWYNPAARGCKTCVHYVLRDAEPDVGYQGEEYCSLAVPWSLSNAGLETLNVHCDQWEAS
jgi:hypothetical protein